MPPDRRRLRFDVPAGHPESVHPRVEDQPTLDDLPRRRTIPDDPRIVVLWRECPDCGHVGAHHSYTDRAGESVGTRCG